MAQGPIHQTELIYTSFTKALELFPKQYLESLYFRPIPKLEGLDLINEQREFENAWNYQERERADRIRMWLEKMSSRGFNLRASLTLYFEYEGFGEQEKLATFTEITSILDFGDPIEPACQKHFYDLINEDLEMLSSEIFGIPECSGSVHPAGIMNCRLIIHEIF